MSIKNAQQILDKFKGDMGKAKDYITQVITDRKKEQAFNDYKAFKVAVDSIQKGKSCQRGVQRKEIREHMVFNSDDLGRCVFKHACAKI